MALVTCPECGRKVSERADACPNCGYPICASLQKSKQEEAQKDFDRGEQYYHTGDYQNAFKYVSIAAEKGLLTAQRNLGVLYENGTGVLQDYHKAIEWYQRASEQGDTLAQLFLAFIYADGKGGIPQDYQKAVELYQKSANRGNAQAQWEIGSLYYEDLLRKVK